MSSLATSARTRNQHYAYCDNRNFLLNHLLDALLFSKKENNRLTLAKLIERWWWIKSDRFSQNDQKYKVLLILVKIKTCYQIKISNIPYILIAILCFFSDLTSFHGNYLRSHTGTTNESIVPNIMNFLSI